MSLVSPTPMLNYFGQKFKDEGVEMFNPFPIPSPPGPEPTPDPAPRPHTPSGPVPNDPVPVPNDPTEPPI